MDRCKKRNTEASGWCWVWSR